MDWKEVPIPAVMQDRPKDERGYPITYVTWVDDQGVPDFRVVDEVRRRECMERLLCGICGQLLDYWMFFVGGPLAMHNRLFNDPPMHEACAHYASVVCPFLANDTARYKKVPEGELAERGLVEDEYGSSERPDAMGIGRTRGYDLRKFPGKERTMLYFHANPWKEVEWVED